MTHRSTFERHIFAPIFENKTNRSSRQLAGPTMAPLSRVAVGCFVHTSVIFSRVSGVIAPFDRACRNDLVCSFFMCAEFFFFFENSDRLLCGWIWIFWKVDGIYFDLSWFSKISWIVGLWGFVIVIWWVYFYFELRLMEFVWVWIWNFCIARFDLIQIKFNFLNIKINLWLYWNKLKEINFNVSILRDLKWLWKLFSNYSFISVWFSHSKFNFLMQIKFNLLNIKFNFLKIKLILLEWIENWKVLLKQLS